MLCLRSSLEDCMPSRQKLFSILLQNDSCCSNGCIIRNNDTEGQPRIFGDCSFHMKFDLCVCVCVRAQSCLTLCNPTDCNLPGSSVHGIFHARILEWAAISSLGRPNDQTHVFSSSCIWQADSLPLSRLGRNFFGESILIWVPRYSKGDRELLICLQLNIQAHVRILLCAF